MRRVKANLAWVLNYVLAGVSAVGLLACLFFTIAGYANAWRLDVASDGLIVVVVLLGFATFALYLARGLKPASSSIQYRGHPWTVVAMVLAGAVLINRWYLYTHGLSDGTPVRIGAHYALDAHGTITYVSRARWERGHALELRATSAFGLGFAMLLVVNLSAARAPRRRDEMPASDVAD